MLNDTLECAGSISYVVFTGMFLFLFIDAKQAGNWSFVRTRHDAPPAIQSGEPRRIRKHYISNHLMPGNALLLSASPRVEASDGTGSAGSGCHHGSVGGRWAGGSSRICSPKRSHRTDCQGRRPIGTSPAGSGTTRGTRDGPFRGCGGCRRGSAGGRSG